MDRRTLGKWTIGLALILSGAASATEMGFCVQRGDLLAERLWESRKKVLMRKYQLEDGVTASAKPKMTDALFFDRITFGLGYGNAYSWEAESVSEPYVFKSDKRSWSGEIKYTIPVNLFRGKGPSSAAVDDQRNYAVELERAAFFDLIYDLRISLAERDAANETLRPVWALRAEKNDARIRNLTEEKGHAMDCIRLR